MRKIQLTAVAAIALLLIISCKKSDNVSNTRTVQNISGSYNLTALTWSALGVTVNVYDSLPPCEKDNTLQFNTDGTAHLIDTKILCDPPEADSVSTWSLSAKGDSLYLDHNPYFIKSWDGKTLVITGIVDFGPPPVTGVTTFVKQ